MTAAGTFGGRGIPVPGPGYAEAMDLPRADLA
jgi:hypothetical protein